MAFALLTYLLRKFASYTCAWEGQFAQCSEHVRTCHATGHGIQPAHFGHVMYVHQLLARRGTCAGFGAKDRAYGKHCCCCSSSAHRRSAHSLASTRSPAPELARLHRSAAPRTPRPSDPSPGPARIPRHRLAKAGLPTLAAPLVGVACPLRCSALTSRARPQTDTKVRSPRG